MAASNTKDLPSHVKDMRNRRFGSWIVLSFAVVKPDGLAAWLCRCECGTEKELCGSMLRKGESKSCGCRSRENVTTHGGWSNPLYYVWHGMWKRCTKPTANQSEHYFGRGITVCDRWRDPLAFYADMGPRPSAEHSLDRIDNNGNYEPSNCRWATSAEQMRNTSRTQFITHHGQTLCIADWAGKFGISPSVLRSRLISGWDVERALTQRVRSRPIS
jgi:hypothetical protein